MKPKLIEARIPKFSENLSSFFVSLVVNEIFNFEDRTSDGENFRRSGEMTLQYISYSTPKVQRSVVFLSNLHLSGFSKGLM